MNREDITEVVEKYCINSCLSYQITDTEGKPQDRFFEQRGYVETGKLTDAILSLHQKEIDRVLEPIKEIIVKRLKDKRIGNYSPATEACALLAIQKSLERANNKGVE